MNNSKIFDIEKTANDLRKKTLDMCINAGTGHVTSSMCCAEIMACLYFGGILNYNPKDPDLDDRDRFILSKGQASPIYYVTLAMAGFYPLGWLDRFVGGKDGSGKNAPFGVHLQCTVPGVEFTTGSLGHGLGYAVGMAESSMLDEKDHLVFVLLGDGELYEGSNWEAVMYASHHKLTNLIAIVDRNKMCTNDYTEKIVNLDPLDKKWSTFGWDVELVNGHSVEELMNVFTNSRNRKITAEKPLVIIADTVKGKGISSMTDKLYLHGLAPHGKKAETAMQELESFIINHKKNGGYID